MGASHSGALAVDVSDDQSMLAQGKYAFCGVELETGEWVPKAYLHDERLLPHQLAGSMEATFPKAVAGREEEEEVPEATDALEERGRRIGNRSKLLRQVKPGLATK